MHNQITYETIKESNDTVCIDVRTPAEYAHAHIPGALSLPVLLDEEHAAVSIEYTRGDKSKARAMGVQCVSKRLPLLFETIQQLAQTHETVVLYCWRGGYRSHALASLLQSLGVSVHKLSGGYKDYRRYVNQSWEKAMQGKEFIALYGDTGTGKTDLLHALDAKDMAVIDLEGLAKHRGSLLGGIGLPAQPSQKMFESLLQEALFALPEGPVFIEGESRKIGDLFLPQPVYGALQTAGKTHILSKEDTRIRRLQNEYASHPKEEIIDVLNRMAPMIGDAATKRLVLAYADGRVEEVIQQLLEKYYDPKYHYRKKEYLAGFSHEDTESTASELIRFVSSQR